MTVFDRITRLIEAAGVDYEVSYHDDVYTSAEAHSATGFPMASAAKSILFRLEGRFVLVVLGGDEKVDFRKLKNHFASRRARLARAEEVEEVMGVRIGACYPFGPLIGIDMLVDKKLAENENITFSPGTHDSHIKMRWIDYQKVTSPTLIDIVK